MSGLEAWDRPTIERCAEIAESHAKQYTLAIGFVATDIANEIRALPSSSSPEGMEQLSERVHYAEGVAELAMKHRNEAESSLAAIVELLKEAGDHLTREKSGSPPDAQRRDALLANIDDALAASPATHWQPLSPAPSQENPQGNEGER